MGGGGWDLIGPLRLPAAQITPGGAPAGRSEGWEPWWGPVQAPLGRGAGRGAFAPAMGQVPNFQGSSQEQKRSPGAAAPGGAGSSPRAAACTRLRGLASRAPSRAGISGRTWVWPRTSP